MPRTPRLFRGFVSPALTLVLSPASLALLFEAFGPPAVLATKERFTPREAARAMWGGEMSAALAEAGTRAAAIGTPRGRDAFREAAADARAEGHFEDGRIDRALGEVGAPVAEWGTMVAEDLAVALVVARARPGGEALEAVFERAELRLGRSLPAPVPYELASRAAVAQPEAVRPDVLAAQAREAAGASAKGWADAWAERDEDGAIRIAVLRAGAPSASFLIAGNDGLGERREVSRALAVDLLCFRPGEGRLSIATADPSLVLPYAAAVGAAAIGDAGALVEHPALTLKKVQMLGYAGLRRVRMPAPVLAKAVVALQLDDLRGLRTEARGARALASVEAKLRAGGYLTRATFRFTIEGAAHPVDAYVELPNRLSVSDPRYEAPVRAALVALGVMSPGAYKDDLTTLAPWVHPEWRWREMLGKQAFDELVRAKILVRAAAAETGGRVAHEDSRTLAGSVRAFPLKNARDRGRHYAVTADGAAAARTVTSRDLVMWKLAMPARRARLRAAMELVEGAPIALPRGVADLGRLDADGVRVRFVEIVRAVGEREARRIAREIRRAVGKELVVVLVPEGKTLGGVLAEVPLDLARQLGAGSPGDGDASYADVVLRAAKELDIEDDLPPWRFATRAAPLVIVSAREEVWLGRVKLQLTSKHYVMLDTLADGKVWKSTDLGARMSPGATDLAHAVHKAKSELDARIARSFRDAGVKRPPEWTADAIVARAGNRSFRLGIGCVRR